MGLAIVIGAFVLGAFIDHGLSSIANALSSRSFQVYLRRTD